jgi:hypothetical protein
VTCTVQTRNAYKILVGKPKGKRPLGRSWRRWEDNIKMLEGKSKVVPVLFFITEHDNLKSYWGAEVWVHAFLTSSQDGEEWSVSRPGRFTPRERTLDTCWIGG